MPFGWAGRDLRRCRTTSSSQLKSTRWLPPTCSSASRAAAATWSSAVRVSTVSGSCPCSPSTTALSEPWPRPVAPREPNSSAWTRAVASAGRRRSSPSVNCFAARIGPTVCDDDGPMPTENRSRTLSAIRAPRGRRTPAWRPGASGPGSRRTRPSGTAGTSRPPVFQSTTGMCPISVARAVPALNTRGCRSSEQLFSRTARARGAGELEGGAVGGQVHHLARRAQCRRERADQGRRGSRALLRGDHQELVRVRATGRLSPSRCRLTSPLAAGRPPADGRDLAPAVPEPGSTRMPAMVWNGISFRRRGARHGAGRERLGQVRGRAAADSPESIDVACACCCFSHLCGSLQGQKVRFRRRPRPPAGRPSGPRGSRRCGCGRS